MTREEIVTMLEDSALPSETWNTAELQHDFAVEGFAMGMVVVRRRADQVRGSMRFQHMPRIYFGFEEA